MRERRGNQVSVDGCLIVGQREMTLLVGPRKLGESEGNYLVETGPLLSRGGRGFVCWDFFYCNGSPSCPLEE